MPSGSWPYMVGNSVRAELYLWQPGVYTWADGEAACTLHRKFERILRIINDVPGRVPRGGRPGRCSRLHARPQRNVLRTALIGTPVDRQAEPTGDTNVQNHHADPWRLAERP